MPGFNINADTPLTTASGSFNKSIPVYFNRAPANFSFPAQADLQVDTGSNYLALTLSKLHAELFDLETSRQIAVGDVDHITFPAKQFSPLSVPLNFSYVASNTSDQTCERGFPLLSLRRCGLMGLRLAGANWYNGCRNSAFSTDGKRPTVQFRLILSFDIPGLLGTKHAATDVTNAACPIELPQNAP